MKHRILLSSHVYASRGRALGAARRLVRDARNCIYHHSYGAIAWSMEDVFASFVLRYGGWLLGVEVEAPAETGGHQE